MENINQIVINEDLIRSRSKFTIFRKFLFTSIFSGEYYSTDFSEKITSLIEELDNTYENFSLIINKNITKRYELARDCLLHYQYLNLFITNRLRDNYSTKIYNFESEDVFSKTSFFEETTISFDKSFH